MPIPALEYASRLRVRLAASTALPIHHQRAPGLASVVTSGHAIFCAERVPAQKEAKIIANKFFFMIYTIYSAPDSP